MPFRNLAETLHEFVSTPAGLGLIFPARVVPASSTGG